MRMAKKLLTKIIAAFICLLSRILNNLGERIMRIKDLPTKEDISNAYVAVDDDNGSGKVPVSDLGGDTVLLEYGDESTYDDVLAMLNAGKRVLVKVDPFFSNSNALDSNGEQVYPVSPYMTYLEASIPTGNPYITFDGSVSGYPHYIAQVVLFQTAVEMPTKINSWCVITQNPIVLALKSDIATDSSTLVYVIDYASDDSIKGASSNSCKKFLDINAEGDGITGGEGGHTMRLSLCGVDSDTYGGVGLWDGVLSYVQAKVVYIPTTGEITRYLTITPLQVAESEV